MILKNSPLNTGFPILKYRFQYIYSPMTSQGGKGNTVSHP